MDYQRLYDELIRKARSEDRAKGNGVYYEAHHIVPRCMRGEGKVSQWKTHPNIILLTAREHFYAHHYLTKIYPDNLKLVYALWMMCNPANSSQRRDYSLIEEYATMYEDIRLKVSATRKGSSHSEETRAKMSTALKGKTKPPRSEEHRAKMSTALKGKTKPLKSEEHRAKVSAALKGRPLSEEHRAKISAACKGRVSHNKGKTFSEEHKAAMREGWKLRREGKILNKS